jgi:hypothetical protein
MQRRDSRQATTNDRARNQGFALSCRWIRQVGVQSGGVYKFFVFSEELFFSKDWRYIRGRVAHNFCTLFPQPGSRRGSVFKRSRVKYSFAI